MKTSSPSVDPDPAAVPLSDTAPADRFCDLVMKGGITSGVVYPGAIVELAGAYRFKNIGGTSAGAIAAAITAAAEYRRRTDGSMAGFELLRDLPQRLGESVGGRSRLLSLFRPEPSTARLFEALLSMLNRDSTARRWLFGVPGFLRAYWLFALIGLAAAVFAGAGLSTLLSGHADVLAVCLLGLLGAVAGVVTGVVLDLVRGVVPNGFGLCKCGPARVASRPRSWWNWFGQAGSIAKRSEAPALVPWLHELVQQAAGRTKDDAPLTFSDLWQAPGFPPAALEPESEKTREPVRSINLQVFTTNLTHGRPYHLPLRDDTSRLFFLPAQIGPYFPADVMEHLNAHSKPYEKLSVSDPEPAMATPGLQELPYGALPVVVAARLSMSFPLLLSAVPLWAIDYDAERGRRTTGQCWFSDGGICSNFPIHLFDSFVPMWPTFGINLGPRSRRDPDAATWLPQRHDEGRGDTWNRFAETHSAIGRLGGFLAAIVSSAQNWNDAATSRMPGVRDRIAHVRLLDSEGGLNLDMPPALIEKLSGYGAAAGQKLRDKFASAAGQPPTRGWREHRWVRFNVTLFALRERLSSFAAAAHSAPHSTDLQAQIRSALTTPPLAGEPMLNPAQAQALQHLLDALEETEAAFASADVPQPWHPLPEPALRVRPPL